MSFNISTKANYKSFLDDHRQQPLNPIKRSHTTTLALLSCVLSRAQHTRHFHPQTLHGCRSWRIECTARGTNEPIKDIQYYIYQMI